MMNNDKAMKDVLHQAYCCSVIKYEMNRWLAGIISDAEFQIAYNKWRASKDAVYNEED